MTLMNTQGGGGPYLAFAVGCGWGEAAELHCRHEPPPPERRPRCFRDLSQARPWLRPLRSLAVKPERLPASWNIEMCNQSIETVFLGPQNLQYFFFLISIWLPSNLLKQSPWAQGAEWHPRIPQSARQTRVKEIHLACNEHIYHKNISLNHKSAPHE